MTPQISYFTGQHPITQLFSSAHKFHHPAYHFSDGFLQFFRSKNTLRDFKISCSRVNLISKNKLKSTSSVVIRHVGKEIMQNESFVLLVSCLPLVSHTLCELAYLLWTNTQTGLYLSIEAGSIRGQKLTC